MDYKPELITLRTLFRSLSEEYLYYSETDTDEREKYRHLGRGQAYDLAAVMVDRLIKSDDLSEE